MKTVLVENFGILVNLLITFEPEFKLLYYEFSFNDFLIK